MDIMASILKETKRASRKTKIMYSCNLSFRQLKLYLKLLVGERFLKVIPITESNVVAEAFQITEEGRSFLRAYDNLREKFPRSSGC
jgi:predicted transcriptional regulator